MQLINLYREQFNLEIFSCEVLGGESRAIFFDRAARCELQALGDSWIFAETRH
jgi:hypothetical protein